MLLATGMVFPIVRGGRFGIVNSFCELRRIGLWGLLALSISLAGCGVTLAPPGFVREHRHRVCRGWFDWNSHRRFSFTLETYDRLPPDSARVKLFRWSHGGSVEKPREIAFENQAIYSEAVIAPEVPAATIPNPPTAEESAGESPASDDSEWLPPPAPPSEMQDLSLPLPNDPAENAGEKPPSESGAVAPSIPAVSISFAESLDEPAEEGSKNSAACGVPIEPVLAPE